MWYFAYCIFQLGDCLFKLPRLGEASEVKQLSFDFFQVTFSIQESLQIWIKLDLPFALNLNYYFQYAGHFI